MFRPNKAETDTAGFTLIEVLVALAIVTLSLSSIGALVATSVRGTVSIERHLIELETARAIFTALPDRHQLVAGTLSGVSTGYHWRVDVSPFPTMDRSARRPVWIPLAVVVTVGSAGGGMLRLETVRLQRSAGG